MHVNTHIHISPKCHWHHDKEHAYLKVILVPSFHPKPADMQWRCAQGCGCNRPKSFFYIRQFDALKNLTGRVFKLFNKNEIFYVITMYHAKWPVTFFKWWIPRLDSSSQKPSMASQQRIKPDTSVRVCVTLSLSHTSAQTQERKWRTDPAWHEQGHAGGLAGVAILGILGAPVPNCQLHLVLPRHIPTSRP